jgi:HSP20 family molecular chaperone IbpA
MSSLLPYIHSDPFDAFGGSVYPIRRHHYRFNPFRELERVERELDSAFGEFERSFPSAVEHPTTAQSVQYNERGDLGLRYPTAGFKPEELSVDLDGDCLTVSGKHQERTDSESVERHFTRTVRLGRELDVEKIRCELAESGELQIQVPRREQLEAPKKSVPIEMKRGQEAIQQNGDKQ